MSIFRKSRRSSPRRFTLVLGGGGARGLAHIGVLKVLEAEGLRPSLIVGTSMGAIVGAMYAQRPDAAAAEERMRALLRSKSFLKIGLNALSHDGAPDGLSAVEKLYGRVKRGYGMLKAAWSAGIVEVPILVEFLSRLIDDRPIEQCEIPFVAVSCNLMTGEEFACRRGPILLAVAASSAIPGVVSPVKVQGKNLVDGGPTSMVPVDAARRLSTLPVIAVNVTRGVPPGRRVTNAIDVVLRAGAIARMQLTEYNLRDADIVLRPRVNSFGWADFASYGRIIAEGERTARAELRNILKSLSGKK